jgi:hypothetical protein
MKGISKRLKGIIQLIIKTPKVTFIKGWVFPIPMSRIWPIQNSYVRQLAVILRYMA